MDKLLHLEIVSPEKKVFEGDVTAVTAPGVLGEFQVLYNHAPLVSTLEKGRIKIIFENESEKLYNTSGGLLEVRNNKVSILAESVN
jgi:F-type H+-transporting ATPase subunit epsilon